MNTRPIVLASASPRRAQLLQQIGVAFEAQAADVDETPRTGEAPEALTRRLALAKAQVLAHRQPGALVIGADTVVAQADDVFGKPRDRAHALHMLTRLSGCTHRVCTGIAVVSASAQASHVSVSEVRMGELTPAAIEAYWASGEPRGKAGAYAIQGLGAVFVEHLAGSYSAVMGLPLHTTARLLRDFGVDVLAA